jgi:predicted transcriptional regulator
MADTITVTLSKDAKVMLDDLRQQEDISLNELASEAIEEYVFFRRFRLLRERMTTKAKAQGIYTDQDVFERVS